MAYTASSGRVAKNTLLLYIRMFIVMGVNIFTSRVILQSLGVVDYGVYNVVGGIAFSFGFFQTALTNATQRYLCVGLGKSDIAQVKEYFNLITVLFLIASGAILLIGGSLGFWIVSVLNIPQNLYDSGVVVYYCTLVSLVITLFSSSYNSALIARENMAFYAYISIAEVVIKLGVAYVLFVIPSFRLEIFALLSLATNIIIKGILILYCRGKFPECKFKLIWQPHKLKGICSFMGWNFLGTTTFIVNQQGINILINLFFGPAVNAARGISDQVNAAIVHFTSNFFMALNPQIIKRYAAGDKAGSIRMMQKASLFSFLLLWLICLPVILRRDYILALWLKDVPPYASILLLWTLMYSLVNVFTTPQWTVIQAVGNLKIYIINGCVTMLGTIPISYALYRYGTVPQTALVVMVALRGVYVLVSLHTIRKFIPFSIARYAKNVFLPVIIVASATYLFMYPINLVIVENFGGLVAITLVSIILIGGFSMMVMDKSDRKRLIGAVAAKIGNHRV